MPKGKTKTKISDDGKTYVEKAVPESEKPPLFVLQRGPELKLVLGGYIQFNAEGGDAFAFNGNFGQTAINDRFRLRRARINLTGDFAEQFDFKMEGDFAVSDGLSNNRLAFEATDIWINWHQFAAAQIKAGQYKAPFGLEQLTPDTTLYTIERSLPTNAIPLDLIGEYLQEHVEGRTVNGVAPAFGNFTTDGFYVTGAYFLVPKKLQAAVQWQYLNPGQKGNDGLYSILGGLNYYIRGDDPKLMVNYIHTWSDFRQANPEFGEDR